MIAGRSCQRGVVLLIVLIWLLAMMLLGISGVQIGQQESKAARSYRERELAWRSAEAALLDAQSDIDASPDPIRTRSAMFAGDTRDGFPTDDQPVCAAGGLCRATLPGEPSVSVAAGLRDASFRFAVQYGQFTGRAMQTGVGSLPAQAPRYVIQILPDPLTGPGNDTLRHFYRITAIGFGAMPSTHIVLQSYYRKGHSR